jgi:hypothetical protein
MTDKNKDIGKIIIFSLIFFIIGGIAGYFIGGMGGNAVKGEGSFREGGPNFPNGNFQINDSVKSEITSFFESTSNTEEINNYCQNNLRYCMEYCRNINPSHEICNELNASFRGGMPAR